jgi:uncharacterized protein YktB (UPF0637 family)
MIVARRIKGYLENPRFINEIHQDTLTVDAAVVNFPNNGLTEDELLAQCEQAMDEIQDKKNDIMNDHDENDVQKKEDSACDGSGGDKEGPNQESS